MELSNNEIDFYYYMSKDLIKDYDIGKSYDEKKDSILAILKLDTSSLDGDKNIPF